MLLTALLATSPASAAPPDDKAIGVAVNEMYGKEVPAQAVCIVRPDLPDELAGAIPVAVRRGSRGCVLLGVMVGDTLVKPDGALTAQAGDEAWVAMAPEARAGLMTRWVADVLLAFTPPEAEPVVAARGDGAVVTASYLHRTEESDVAGRSAGTWTFDGTGALTDVTAELGDRWRTTFFVRPDKVEGVATDVVLSALTSKGRTLKACWTEAWERDLELAGVIKLTWTVSGGKASELGVVSGNAEPVSLAKCYARVVRTIEFPEEVSGSVRWSFSAVKASAN